MSDIKKNVLQKVLAYVDPLYFENEVVKYRYDDWIKPSKQFQIRLITLLTGILYVVYAQIDKHIAPSSVLPVMIFFHQYVLPITLFLISALTFNGRAYKIMIYMLLVAPIGAAIANMFILISLKDFTIYLPEIYLIIIWTFAVSGLKLLHASISAVITSASVLLINYFLFPMQKDIYIMHGFWMLSAFSFGFLIAFIVERSDKIIFLNRRELGQLATIDKLTGLFNRYKIEKIITQEIQRAKRYRSDLSVILLDVDDFKVVNDIHGHHTGDVVLQEFSRLLKNSVRKVDVVSRWGGEEFLILLVETDLDEAKKVSENLRKKIESFEFTTVKNKTSSFGIAQFSKDDTIESLIVRADKALYKAKNSGKNRVEVL